jgi:hypothetical protein
MTPMMSRWYERRRGSKVHRKRVDFESQLRSVATVCNERYERIHHIHSYHIDIMVSSIPLQSTAWKIQ